MQIKLNHLTIELIQGDITDLALDAIVSAATTSLNLGTGVAGAIRLKGGSTIQDECNKIGYCEVGSAVITGAGELRAKHVIHAVGPRLGEGNEKQKLASATRAALTLAEQNGLESIGFPAISTGVFGYPIEACAKVMLEEIIIAAYDKDLTHLKRIVMCLFDERAYQIFAQELQARLTELT
jgi:O-acetyl-ADP-ribose deacetylase (regulator of RNase III)